MWPGRPSAVPIAGREFRDAPRTTGLAAVLRLGERGERLDHAEHHALHVIHGAHDLGVGTAAAQHLPERVGDLRGVAAGRRRRRAAPCRRAAARPRPGRRRASARRPGGAATRAGRPAAARPCPRAASRTDGLLRVEALLQRGVGRRRAAPARQHRQVLAVARCAAAAGRELELPRLGQRQEHVRRARCPSARRRVRAPAARISVSVSECARCVRSSSAGDAALLALGALLGAPLRARASRTVTTRTPADAVRPRRQPPRRRRSCHPAGASGLRTATWPPPPTARLRTVAVGAVLDRRTAAASARASAVGARGRPARGTPRWRTAMPALARRRGRSASGEYSSASAWRCATLVAAPAARARR